MHFSINLAKNNIMKIRTQNNFIFTFIESIVLGFGHSLGGHQVPPLDSITDKCLPQSSWPPGKVRAIDSET